MAAADIKGPDTASMRKAYARWAPVYDLIYDKLTAPARQRAVSAALPAARASSRWAWALACR